jgi:hypothetical protein
MKETSARDLAEDSSWVAGKAVRKFGPLLSIKRPPGIQVVGAVEYSAHHIPLRQPEGVKADGVEHAPIILSLRSRPSRAGRSVSELGWS